MGLDKTLAHRTVCDRKVEAACLTLGTMMVLCEFVGRRVALYSLVQPITTAFDNRSLTRNLIWKTFGARIKSSSKL